MNRRCAGFLLRRAFSLVECILALALFAFAAVVIGQVCYNCVYPLSIADKNTMLDADIERAIKSILDVEDYNALDDGVEVKTLDGRTCRIYGESFPTQIIDLFELRIRIEGEGMDDITDTVYAIRPAWYESSNDRQTLVDDRLEFLENKRLEDAEKMRSADDEDNSKTEAGYVK